MMADYARAEKTAYRTILSLNIIDLPIQPIDILRRCKNTAIHTYDEVMAKAGMPVRYLFKMEHMKNQDAVTLRHVFENGTIGYELFYDSHANPSRRQFTLAHELGHILLHHHMENEEEEKEANHFASFLLMPRPALELFAGDVRDTSEILELTTTVFSVSASAAQIALKDMPPCRNEYYPLIQHQFDHYVTPSIGA